MAGTIQTPTTPSTPVEHCRFCGTAYTRYEGIQGPPDRWIKLDSWETYSFTQVCTNPECRNSQDYSMTGKLMLERKMNPKEYEQILRVGNGKKTQTRPAEWHREPFGQPGKSGVS